MLKNAPNVGHPKNISTASVMIRTVTRSFSVKYVIINELPRNLSSLKATLPTAVLFAAMFSLKRKSVSILPSINAAMMTALNGKTSTKDIAIEPMILMSMTLKFQGLIVNL